MKNDKKRTYLLITIPILALFVCFNHTADPGRDLQFHQLPGIRKL